MLTFHCGVGSIEIMWRYVKKQAFSTIEIKFNARQSFDKECITWKARKYSEAVKYCTSLNLYYQNSVDTAWLELPLST